MDGHEVARQKRVWFFTVLGFVELAILLLLVVVFAFGKLDAKPNNALVAPFGTIAVLCTCVAGYIALLRLAPKPMGSSQFDVPSLRAFRAQSLTALAVAEMPALMGFVLSVFSPAWQLIGVFIVPSFIIELGFILPAGLRYWKLLEGK